VNGSCDENTSPPVIGIALLVGVNQRSAEVIEVSGGVPEFLDHVEKVVNLPLEVISL